MRRPRLKQTVTVVDGGDDSVYLLRPGYGDTALRGAGPAWGAFLRALDGSRSVAEAAGALDPGEARIMVAQLADAGLVEDAVADERVPLPAERRERFDRQLRYFADRLPAGESGLEAQARLAASRVAVLGLGGLGSWTVLALACAGVGRITGVDRDRVELSNLNRQVLYRLADVGRAKPRAAATAIARFDPEVAFVPMCAALACRADVARAIDGADVVVALADAPAGEIQRWVDGVCFERGVPYVTASQMPPLVRVGPTYVPGGTGCFACQEARWRREHPLYDAVLAEERARDSRAATFGPASGLAGSLLASEVVTLLGGLGRPATEGRSVTFDLRDLSTDWQPVTPEPGCPRCGA